MRVSHLSQGGASLRLIAEMNVLTNPLATLGLMASNTFCLPVTTPIHSTT